MIVAPSDKRFYLVHRDPLKSYFRLSSSQVWTRIEFSHQDVVREGWLGQRGMISHSWKLRYCVLLADSSSLLVLRDRASMIQVSEVLIDKHTSLIQEKSVNLHQYQFVIINGDHTLRLNAVDGTSRARWMSAISELIVRSRSSFVAGDESESGNSGRNRSYRRLRSSTEDDVSIHSASMFSDVASDSISSHAQSSWRPYRLISSTMQTKRTVSKQVRNEYMERFAGDMQIKIDVATSFLEENVDILEENYQRAEEYLSAAVVTVPKNDIEKLRVTISEAFRAFEKEVDQVVRSPSSNVLACNILLKKLYLLTTRLQGLILAFVSPPSHETIKKIIVESPTRRRIPMDWFTEPVDYGGRDKMPQSVSDDSTVSSNSTPGKHLEMSYTSGSSLEMKKPGSRSLTIPEGHTPVASEAIKVKAYKEMPEILSKGHFELPSGVNGFVVKVHDKDLSSLIAFTLCSKEYIEELETHFAGSLDIAKELMNSPSHQEENNNANSSPTTPGSDLSPTMDRISDKKKQIYLKKLESNDVEHTDMKFSFESGTSSHDVRCVTFFAAQFHALRALTLPGNVEFLNSLVESNRWDTSGGKSGAFFAQVSASI